MWNKMLDAVKEYQDTFEEPLPPSNQTTINLAPSVIHSGSTESLPSVETTDVIEPKSPLNVGSDVP